jgi:hypothetical protein
LPSILERPFQATSFFDIKLNGLLLETFIAVSHLCDAMKKVRVIVFVHFVICHRLKKVLLDYIRARSKRLLLRSHFWQNRTNTFSPQTKCSIYDRFRSELKSAQRDSLLLWADLFGVIPSFFDLDQMLQHPGLQRECVVQTV